MPDVTQVKVTGSPGAPFLKQCPWPCAQTRLLWFHFEEPVSASQVYRAFSSPGPQSSWGTGRIRVALGDSAPAPGVKGTLPGEGARVTVWGGCPHAETGDAYWEAAVRVEAKFR